MTGQVVTGKVASHPVDSYSRFGIFKISPAVNFCDLAPGQLFVIDPNANLRCSRLLQDGTNGISAGATVPLAGALRDSKIPVRQKRVHWKMSSKYIQNFVYYPVAYKPLEASTLLNWVDGVAMVYPVKFERIAKIYPETLDLPAEALDALESLLCGHERDATIAEEIVRDFCLTPDQKQWLESNGFSPEKLLDSMADEDSSCSGLKAQIYDMLRDWNLKLGECVFAAESAASLDSLL